MPLGGLVTAGLVLGAGQAVLGTYQTIKGNAAKNKALAKRKPYQTPQEVFDLLNATESNAQLGFNPETLAYLTNQTDRAFTGALGAASRLGADPNDLSALFDQKMQAIMKIGAQDHAYNMENFSKYLSALDSVAANKAAEQKSEQDIIKDQLQSSAQEIQTGTANISGGLNTAIGAFGSGQTANLYKQNAVLKNNLQQTVMNAAPGYQAVNPFAGQAIQTADGVLPNVVTNLNSNLYTPTFGG